MQRILMVCLGNICRSPLAEGILREKTKEVSDIKTKYELDEDVQKKVKEIRDLKDNVDKLLVDRERLNKLNRDIEEKLLAMKIHHNSLAEEYNKMLDEIKINKKELEHLQKQVRKFSIKGAVKKKLFKMEK